MAEASGSKGVRLYSLDAARAIAALAVVLQHWQHFLWQDRFAAPVEASPLYWLFSPFYDKGARAVTFFFCLSGFIFYWLYARKVREKVVGPASFSVLRLSRLYPLHFATLLACVALQWPLIEMLGHPVVVENNDVRHFVLNLFLVQYWGFENGFSFNGPSWSISVEIFLYIAFFVACRFLRPSVWQCLAFAFVGLLLARYSVLANSAVAFFIGGAAFHVYRALAERWTPARNAVLVAVVIALWVVIPPLIYHPDILQGVLAQLPAGLSEGRVGDLIATGVREITERQFEFVLFPATVVTLALSEIAWKRVPWAWLHQLGNMSYGIYLLHFPLQLAVISIALAFSFPPDFFTSPVSLIGFVALVIAVAAASYHGFEKPVMLAIRRMWVRARSRAARDKMPAPAPTAAS